MRTRIFSFQFGVLLIIALLLSDVQSVVFDHGFYLNLYEKIHLADREGISEDDLNESIFMMTDYVEGKRDDLNGTITWKNQVQPTFNEKEITHMTDVRNLWLRAQKVMIFCWIGAAVFGALVLLEQKWKGLEALAHGLFSAGICLAVVLVFFGFWCLIDFTGFWFWFHTIVFPGNMNWLLNPNTDFMIVICPEEMFSTMILTIALRLIAALLPPFLLAALIRRENPWSSSLRRLPRKTAKIS